MSDIHLIPEYIRCPDCNAVYPFNIVMLELSSSEENEFICKCGKVLTMKYIGKHLGVIKNAGD